MSLIIRIFLFASVICVFANGFVRKSRSITDELKSPTIDQYPYIVAIKYNDSLICSGVIIDKKKILTAAKCIYQCLSKEPEYYRDCEKYMTIVTGTTSLSNGGNNYKVKYTKIRDDFNAEILANDIGIITLQSEILFNDNVKSVSLPDKDILLESIAYTAGWGSEGDDKRTDKFSDTLHSLKEKIISSDNCNKFYSETQLKVDSNDFCATKTFTEKIDRCVGDSGSPFIQDGKLIGISTWGIGCDGQFPDVYTNVFRNLDFIKKELS